MQQAAIGGRHLRNALRQICHVQRARDAVQHRRTDQEQRGRGQIHRDVMQAGLHPRASRAMQQQAVRRRQHDLEEHEQVEQIGGQEGTGQTHQLQLEQRVVMHPGTMPARGREDDRAQRDKAGEHQHHGGESVEHQHDAEGCRPVARQVDAHGGRAARHLAPAQQLDGDDQADEGRHQIDDQLEPLPLFAEQQHDGRRQHRQHDGRENQMRHERRSQLIEAEAAHNISCELRASAPSTWSVPLMPRRASNTTRNNAVIAKPITMAVSTSAWGMGSA